MNAVPRFAEGGFPEPGIWVDSERQLTPIFFPKDKNSLIALSSSEQIVEAIQKGIDKALKGESL